MKKIYIPQVIKEIYINASTPEFLFKHLIDSKFISRLIITSSENLIELINEACKTKTSRAQLIGHSALLALLYREIVPEANINIQELPGIPYLKWGNKFIELFNHEFNGEI